MKKLLPILLLLSASAVFAQNCPVTISSTPPTCSNSCDGTATATGSGGGPYSYQWSNGQTTQTAVGLCPGTYSVIVINGSSCTGVANFTLMGPPPVVVTTTGQNPTSCINCNGMVAGTANGGTPPYFYMWAPSNCSAQTCTGLCAGTYTLTVTDANGCTGSSTWTLQAPAGPSFSVSATAASPPSCNNGTATATTSNPGTYTYAWTPTGQTTATATGLTQGVYTVCVTNTQNGCSACQMVTVSCPTGIEDHSGNFTFSISPNPAQSIITIQFDKPQPANMFVAIYNVVGEKMISEVIGANKNGITIDVSTFAKGIYFLKAENSAGAIITRKFIRE